MAEREPIIGVYAGSFDPITRGHMGIICESVLALDELYILIARNPAKEGKYLLTEEQRLQNIKDAIEDFKNEVRSHKDIVTPNELEAVRRLESGICKVNVEAHSGLTIDFAISKGARQLIRGLRPIGDFESEQTLADLNRGLALEKNYAIGTTFFPTPDERYIFASSSKIKSYLGVGVKRTLYKSLYPSTVELVLEQQRIKEEAKASENARG